MSARQGHKQAASSPRIAAARIISSYWSLCNKEAWMLPALAEGRANKAQKAGYTRDQNILKSLIAVEGLDYAQTIAALEKMGIKQMDRNTMNAHIDSLGAEGMEQPQAAEEMEMQQAEQQQDQQEPVTEQEAAAIIAEIPSADWAALNQEIKRVAEEYAAEHQAAQAPAKQGRGIKAQHNFKGYAGCLQQQKNRITGFLVGVYEAEQAGLDASSGAWATVCEEHGAILNSSNRKDACSAARHPEWCSDCQGIIAAKA